MAATESRTYAVTGMTCGHCESAVSAELLKLPGVEEAKADAQAANVVVVLDPSVVSQDDIDAGIREAGYELA